MTRRLLSILGPLVGLLVIFGAFTAIVGRSFATPNNIENILLQSAVYAMAGLGMTCVIITGGIDLAAGSNIALAMVVTAMTLDAGRPAAGAAAGPLANHPYLWALLAVFTGTAASTLVGVIQGLLITGLRVVPFIVTLGGLTIVRGLAKGIAHDQEINPPEENWLFQHLMHSVQRTDAGLDWRLFAIGVWITLIVAILTAGMLRYTRLGRWVFAVGSSEATARLCGVPVVRTKIAVYALSGLFAGLAGVMEFSKLNLGQPTGAASYELYIITACVIGGASLSGGVGTIAGTLIGAVMIGTLNAGALQAGWDKWVQEVVIGTIIIAAVALDRLRTRRAT